jgi:hypothetical protein
LENSQHAEFEAAELKRLTHKYAVDGEEERLYLLEQIGEFGRNFGHWGIAQYPQHSDRVLAVERAMRVIEAVLQDDEEQMILALDALAFQLGYRIKKGRFDD